MSVRVFIDGAAGTTGLEIRDRLASRCDIVLATLSEADRKDTVARAHALNGADVVILCLPDDAAREAVALIGDPRVRVIDASTAHRTDPAWAYGFAELEPDGRQALSGAMRIANPGCYPTGFLALVRPLVRAGLVPAEALLTVNATSGYSGGGKAMIAAFEAPNAHAAGPVAFEIYGLGLAHKHVPEMQVHAGLAHPPIFAPAVANAYRGMIVEVPLHLHALPAAPRLADLRDCLGDAYRDGKVVVVCDREPGTLRLEQCAGSDRIELHVFGNEDRGQARLVAALDNLGKGAAGAAVQNLNLAAGLDETAGLRL